MRHASWKWLAAIVFVASRPTIALIGGVVAVGSLVGGTSGTTGESSAKSVESSTGVPEASLALYEEAVASTETPWQVLAAIACYESGHGEPVTQTVGVCPSARRPTSGIDSFRRPTATRAAAAGRSSGSGPASTCRDHVVGGGSRAPIH